LEKLFCDGSLDSIAVLTVAVAALELGQTILEEEVQREAQMSAPTRVRRFLSRFMIVLVVSLSIEALVAVFQFNHAQPAHLPYAATIGLMAAALLAAWGLFIWLNRSAEELEPQAMEQAQREDEHVP
jgi:putative Mn2+ efflux pump MntP